MRAPLRCAEGRVSEVVPADSTVLVFNHYGNQYFLSEIRLKGSNWTYKLPESRDEVELHA